VTAYELAAAGVPAIYHRHQRRSHPIGFGLRTGRHGQSLGTMNRISNADIAQAVWSLLATAPAAPDAAAGLMTIDGAGASAHRGDFWPANWTARRAPVRA